MSLTKRGWRLDHQHFLCRWHPLHGRALFDLLRHQGGDDPSDAHHCRAVRAETRPVNVVLPDLMKTPMVEKTAGLAAEYGEGDIGEMWKVRDAQCPMGHMGDAWDVAYACLYLASDESKYVTGLELVVDRGISLKLS
jgi:Enoyl-(Acyl carrier protein) reductase